jgi:hypothetical protein
MAMHTQWIQDIGYDYGAFAYPTDFGAFALSAATLKVDSVQKRGNDEGYQGSFDSVDAAYGLSYARTVGPLTSIGVTGRYVREKIDVYSAAVWSGDIGLLQRLGQRPVSLGLAVRHLGQGVEFRNQSDPLPLTVDVGLGGSFLRERLRMGVNVCKVRDTGVHPGAGIEWNQRLSRDFSASVRTGYNGSRTGADASGFALGGGLSFRQFDLDTAWVPFGDLGNSFRTSALIRF